MPRQYNYDPYLKKLAERAKKENTPEAWADYRTVGQQAVRDGAIPSGVDTARAKLEAGGYTQGGTSPTHARMPSRSVSGPAGTTVTQYQPAPFDRQFDLGTIQALMGQMQDVGQTTDRFGTPDQLVNTIQALVGQMQPLTDARLQEHDVYGQEQMRGLGQDWASRGMLASGGAMSQERQAAADLARQRAGIHAEAQAEAIPLALQYGELGLREDEANRRFLLDRLLGSADIGLRGYGLEEDTRQFDLTHDQRERQFDRKMDQQASQFEREMGLQEGQLMGVFNDQPTLAARQFGEDIRQFEKTHGLREGELLGHYQGQRTLGGQQLDAQQQYWAGQLANQRAQIAQSARNANFGFVSDLMRTTGMTPDDMTPFEQALGLPEGALSTFAAFDPNNIGASEQDLAPYINMLRREGINEEAAIYGASLIYPAIGEMMQEEMTERGSIQAFRDPDIIRDYVEGTIDAEIANLHGLGDIGGANALQQARDKLVESSLKHHGLAVQVMSDPGPDTTPKSLYAGGQPVRLGWQGYTAFPGAGEDIMGAGLETGQRFIDWLTSIGLQPNQ